MNLNGTSAENRHLTFVAVFPRLERAALFRHHHSRRPLNCPFYSHQVREDSHRLNRLILHGDVRVRRRWYPLVRSTSYLQPPLPPQPPQLWATLTEQEERIVELTQEDDDGDR
jgi:hypothetical protein